VAVRNRWDDHQGPDDDGDINTWMPWRTDQAAKLNSPEAEVAGRDAWNASTRSGENLAAKTPSQLRALGATETANAQPVAPAIGADLIGPRNADRLRAAARGSVDAALGGHGDDAEAFVGALPGLFSGKGFGPSYNAARQRARIQDRFDEQNYPVSRGAGEIVGTVGSLLATDGLAAAAVPRFAMEGSAFARMPALTKAEIWKAQAAGAGLGVVGQAASDVGAGRRPDPRDYASAALGGAAMASAAQGASPTFAAAAGAAATAASKSALRGRAPTVAQVAGAMTGAGYFGAAGQVVGERGSNGLDWRDKGKLGENLTEIRLRAQGEKIVARQQHVGLGQRRSTRPDFTLTPDPVTGAPRWPDGKFGPYARPSNSQQLAETIYPGSYRYYPWMPSHVGKITGAALSAFGSPLFQRPTDSVVQPPSTWSY
jgi:hypothetical protein